MKSGGKADAEKSLEEFFEELGFDSETSLRMVRLAKYLAGLCELEEWEKERWRKCGVMEGDVVVFADEDEDETLTWILYGLCWQGLVERTVEIGQAKYKVTKKGRRYVEKKLCGW